MTEIRFAALLAATVATALAEPVLFTSVGIQGTPLDANCSEIGGASAIASCWGSTPHIVPAVPGRDPASLGGFVDGRTFARADFGVLGVYSELHIGVQAHPYYYSLGGNGGVATAFARFEDSLTINHPGLVGTTGFLIYTFDLSGSGILSTPVSNIFNSTIGATLVFELTHDGSRQSMGPGGISDNGAIPGQHSVTSPLQFQFGTPVALQVWMEANIGGFMRGDISQTSDGVLNFANTAVLSGLEVLDSSQNPVAGYSIVSGSNTSYPLQSSVVPEPSTYYLVAGALLAISSLRRRFPRI